MTRHESYIVRGNYFRKMGSSKVGWVAVLSVAIGFGAHVSQHFLGKMRRGPKA